MSESLGNCPECGKPYGMRRRCYGCRPGNPSGVGFRRPRINLDGLDLTPRRRTPSLPPEHARVNGHVKARGTPPKVSNTEIGVRVAEASASRTAPEPQAESPEEMLRRMHAERAREAREQVVRERAEAMARTPMPAAEPATVRLPVETERRPPPSEPASRRVVGGYTGAPVLAEAPAATALVVGPVHVRQATPDWTRETKDAPKPQATADVASAIDPEIRAIADAHAALTGLDEPAIRRALEYLGRKLLGGLPGVVG